MATNDTWQKHIAGGSAFTDAVYYDGAALSVTPANDKQYNPSVDAIEEFKLITGNYSAEYGHALSGVTSFTLKSGTNAFHGTMFEFLRNEKLDARGFFGSEKAATRLNEFGATLGGPVYIPRVYDGRNRTFVFGSFFLFRRRGGQLNNLSSIPGQDFLQGDFRRWPSSIFDPQSNRIDPVTGRTIRAPFDNNLIPQSRLSSVSRNMAALLPAPHFPDRLINNYVSPLVSPVQDDDNFSLKIDHQINSNHKMFGSFIFTNRPAIKGAGPSVTGEAESHNLQNLNSRFFRFAEDWTVSPTVMNHFVAYVNWVVDDNRSLSRGGNWGERLGITGLQGDIFPNARFTQGFALLGQNTDYRNSNNTEGILNNVSMIRGRHSLKFGGEFNRHQDNAIPGSNSGGTFNFSQLETAQPGVSGTGLSIASFMLGEVNNANATYIANSLGSRWSYLAAFVNDDYKLTPNLTLSLGLRWQLQTTFTDPLNRLTYMDPSTPNPGAGGLPGANIFATNGDFNRLGNNNFRDFAPRFGFAYNFKERWVVRGGYGIFYHAVNRQGILQSADGFNAFPQFASADNGITPAFNWDTGFPQNFPRPPTLVPDVQNGQNATTLVPARAGTWPYSQQWNFTIERQVGNTLSIRAAYVGTKGTRLFTPELDRNQVHPSAFAGLGRDLLTSHITSARAQAAGFTEPFPGFSRLWGGRATVAQALRPFPQYNSIPEGVASYGNSTYHSFQLFVQKTMSRGFGFTAAYTYGKQISDTRVLSTGVGYQNAYDRRNERSLDGTNPAQILSISQVYDLPFGRGKAFANSSAVADKLLGGWKVSGIYTYQSGLPLSIATINTLGIFNSTLRADLVPGVPLRAPVGPGRFDPNRDLWINPNAFANPAPGQFGNTARYLTGLRGPAFLSEAIAVVKDTALTEKLTLQFRTEFSNPFNRVVFGAPVDRLDSATFGQITSVGNTPRQIQFGLKLIW
ncbi:MAG: TonB-dependent receptor [Bryobacteraceae bacterium]